MNYSNHNGLRSAMAILSVGLVIVAIHFGVPSSTQEHLALDHGRIVWWAFLTGAYVHNSTQHLLNNLVGFGIGTVVAYQLTYIQNHRHWFWVTTAALLLVLPILVNLTDYVVFQALELEPTSRGFSGVVAGYVGLMLVAVARLISNRHNRRLGLNVGLAILIMLLGEVLVIYTGVPSLLAGVILGIGLAFTLGSVVWRVVNRSWTDEERQRLVEEAGFIAVVAVLLAAFVWVLFPGHLVQDGTATNIIAHFTGFGWGIALATISAALEGEPRQWIRFLQ